MSLSGPSVSSGENKSRAVKTSAPAPASPAEESSALSSEPRLSERANGERHTATTNSASPATRHRAPSQGELAGAGTEPNSEPPSMRNAPYATKSAEAATAPR